MKKRGKTPEIKPFYSDEYLARMKAIQKKREQAKSETEWDPIKGRGMGYSFSVDTVDKAAVFHRKERNFLFPWDHIQNKDNNRGRHNSREIQGKGHKRSSSLNARSRSSSSLGYCRSTTASLTDKWRSRSASKERRRLFDDTGYDDYIPVLDGGRTMRRDNNDESSDNGQQRRQERSLFEDIAYGYQRRVPTMASSALSPLSASPSHAWSHIAPPGYHAASAFSPPASPEGSPRVPRKSGGTDGSPNTQPSSPSDALLSSLLTLPALLVPAEASPSSATRRFLSLRRGEKGPVGAAAVQREVVVRPHCSLRHLVYALRQQFGVLLPIDFDVIVLSSRTGSNGVIKVSVLQNIPEVCKELRAVEDTANKYLHLSESNTICARLPSQERLAEYLRHANGTHGDDRPSSPYSRGHMSSEGIRRKGRTTDDDPMLLDLQIEQLECDLLSLQAMGTARPDHHSARRDASSSRAREAVTTPYTDTQPFSYACADEISLLDPEDDDDNNDSDRRLQKTRKPSGSRPHRQKGKHSRERETTPVQQMCPSAAPPASRRRIGSAHREDPCADTMPLSHHLPVLGRRKKKYTEEYIPATAPTVATYREKEAAGENSIRLIDESSLTCDSWVPEQPLSQEDKGRDNPDDDEAEGEEETVIDFLDLTKY